MRALDWAAEQHQPRGRRLREHVLWLDENFPCQTTVVPYRGQLFHVQLSYNQEHSFMVYRGAFPQQQYFHCFSGHMTYVIDW